MKMIANRLYNYATQDKRFSFKHRQDFRQAADFIIKNYVEIDRHIKCEICGHVSFSDEENEKHFYKFHRNNF